MEPYIAIPTRSTPLVWLDADKRLGIIAGNSMPENANDFYDGVLAWLDQNLTAATTPMRWEFRLSYFNTSSMKSLYQMLLRIKTSMDQGGGHSVVWDVEDDDEFMIEAGEGFIEMLNIPMSLRKLTEKEVDAETRRLNKALEGITGL